MSAKTGMANRAQCVKNVQPLADALHFDLIARERKGQFTIKRAADTMRFESGGVVLDGVRLDIHSSHVSRKEAWLLAHVSGNLWFFILHDVTRKELYLWLLDADQSRIKGVPPGTFDGWDAVRQMCPRLGQPVAVFRRDVVQDKWGEVDGAGSLEQRHRGGAEEGSREGNRLGRTGTPRS